ncbi:hypothetical protein K8R42_04705 [bacterium]|nr:hypothetical protein [bacterium]
MKKNNKTLGASVLLIFIFVGIVMYSYLKIKTFEECENSWFVRSIIFYDYAEYIPGAVEKECKLWGGKSFEKELESPYFGNNKIEKDITDYLLTQKYFSWKTTTSSHNFCIIENLNPTESGLFPLYVWVRCGEFIFQNGKLKELSGKSVPAKINYPNQLSFYDLSKFSYEVPGDGSLYLKDIKIIFPLNVQKVIFDFDISNLNKKIEAIALNSLKQ